MKKGIIFFSIFLIPYLALGQITKEFISFGKLTEIEGTEYVLLASRENKKIAADINSITFINTVTEEHTILNFPSGVFITSLKQIKIDDLGIHKLLIVIRDQNERKSFFKFDPCRLLISSVDGKIIQEITEPGFHVDDWVMNNTTGILTVRESELLPKKKDAATKDSLTIKFYRL